MATVTRTVTANSGDTLTAANYNAEFNNLLNAIAIVNADVSGSAGIVFSKLDSATVAGVAATQTLTNKTLTSPTINTPIMTGAYEAWVTATDGATITFDLSAGNKQRVTLGGNRTLALSNVQNGHAFVIALIQDGTGSRVPTFWSTINWAGGTAPTLTTTASKIDYLGFIQTAADTYSGFVIGMNV